MQKSSLAYQLQLHESQAKANLIKSGALASGIGSMAGESFANADAYYDSNGFLGLGDVAMKNGLAEGITSAGNSLDKSIRMMQLDEMISNRTKNKDKVSADSLTGLNELKAQHIHSVENINKTTGEMTLNCKTKKEL